VGFEIQSTYAKKVVIGFGAKAKKVIMGFG